MNRAGQTTYPVKKWLGTETSRLLKIIPQSRSPGSKMENSLFRPLGLKFFEFSSRFSESAVKNTPVTKIVVDLGDYLERTQI